MAHVAFCDSGQAITCLDPPDIETPGRFEATKSASLEGYNPSIALFHKENDDKENDDNQWI